MLHGNKRLISACVLWLILVGFAAAQNGRDPEAFVNIGNTCESNVARLDRIHSEAGDGLIIAIARLGDGELTRELNRRRLYNIRTYLIYNRARKGKTIITAEGERVSGRGRVEVYVGGKLIDVLGIAQGEDILVGGCDGPDDRFYPLRNYKVLKRRSVRGSNWPHDYTREVNMPAVCYIDSRP